MAFTELLARQDIVSHLRQFQIGLEREALRVETHGHLTQTPHPHSLGSSLTNTYITTDFSEALIELITPVFKQKDQLMHFLSQLHLFTYKNLEKKPIPLAIEYASYSR